MGQDSVKLDLTKLKKIKSHIFYGNKYKIKVKYLPPERSGQCENPYTKNKTIAIDPRQADEKELMTTLIDEALHAFDFKIDNDAVGEISSDIANFLIRAGFGLKD
jgi:superfamily I DNA and/or RNA helicase